MLEAVATYRTYFSDTQSSPDSQVEEVVEEVLDTPWKLILYNDEIHTFDEVINQLIKAINCSISEAEAITLQVHNEGKAIVIEGTFEECLRVNAVLQEIQLVTEIKG